MVKQRILILEEPCTRSSLAQCFSDGNYETRPASTSAEALDAIQQATFDLALIDIEAPGVVAVELQNRLRDMRPDLPLIFMTGRTSIRMAIEAVKRGGYDYITKPVDPDELLHRVGSALEYRRTRQEMARLHATRTLDEIERWHIQRILRETGNNVSRAARILDIDRTTLYNKLRRYGLNRRNAQACE